MQLIYHYQAVTFSPVHSLTLFACIHHKLGREWITVLRHTCPFRDSKENATSGGKTVVICPNTELWTQGIQSALSKNDRCLTLHLYLETSWVMAGGDWSNPYSSLTSFSWTVKINCLQRDAQLYFLELSHNLSEFLKTSQYSHLQHTEEKVTNQELTGRKGKGVPSKSQSHW